MIASLALLTLTTGCVEPPRGWMLSLYGAAVDAEGTLLQGVEVSVASLGTGALMGTVESSDDGHWYLPVFFEVGQEEVLFPVSITAASDGYSDGVTFAEAVLREPLSDYPVYGGVGQAFQTVALRMPPVTLVPAGDDASGSGELLDATTGAPVALARMLLREGYNAPDSRGVDAEVSTDADGAFDITGLPGGVYTAVVEPFSGYALTRFPVTVIPGGRGGQQGLIVPPEGVESFRVALSWDVGVASLDLHMTGPLAGATETAGFHIWSDDPDHPPTDEPVAQMELLSEGLQSAVVNEIREREAYRFSAFDVTNADVVTSSALSETHALMQLWWDGEAWMETVSPGIDATLWRALELDPVTREVLRLQEYDLSVGEDEALYF